tara:strand:- start:33 stop:554 length:522 start_codon:yes stop_codon:yes gene_type:complete
MVEKNGPKDEVEDLGLKGTSSRKTTSRRSTNSKNKDFEELKAKYDAQSKALDAQSKALSAEKAKNKSYDRVDSKFWWVKFAPKSNPNQENQVTLGVNGEMLVMQRNVEVIIPSSYLEVCDHAVVAQYRQMPGEPRRKIGEVKTFPYQLLRPGTQKEFRAKLKEACDDRNNRKL